MSAPVAAHHKDQVFPFFFRGRIRFDYPGNHYPAGRKLELNYLSLVLPVICLATELHTDPNYRLVLTYLPPAPSAMAEPIVSQSRLGLFAGRLHCEKVLAPSRYLTLFNPCDKPLRIWTWRRRNGSNCAGAIETKLPALIDDWKARETARKQGVDVIGTLGILGRNKRRGHIRAAAHLIDAMQQQGIYFGAQLIRRFLHDLNEI
jgi:hypothetical protein